MNPSKHMCAAISDVFKHAPAARADHSLSRCRHAIRPIADAGKASRLCHVPSLFIWEEEEDDLNTGTGFCASTMHRLIKCSKKTPL